MNEKTSQLKEDNNISEHSLNKDSISILTGDNELGSSSYLVSIEKCRDFYHTSLDKGLDSHTAKELLNKYGPNNLGDEGGISLVNIIMHQVFNAMIMVLVISMVIAFAIRDWISGGVITFVFGLNVFVGTIQEFKAEKTMGSLKKLSSSTARVLRDGNDVTIPAEEVVPGDIVMVKVGDTIPADLRLFEAVNFETDEALLTGESLPVAKDPALTFNEIIPVGDRINLAFSSSTVSKGRATGIVVCTGLTTEIGKIADSLTGGDSKVQKVEKDANGNTPASAYAKAYFGTFWAYFGSFLGITDGTPLTIRLSKLAIYLFLIAVVFAIVVMASQKFDVTREVAIYAICVALSMIPSSLVVVLTITMAVGAKVIAERNVVVRRLDSLEALGSVNDICSDKTGTLTQGRMIAKNVWIPCVGTFAVSESNEPFNPTVGKVEYADASPVEIDETGVKYSEFNWFEDGSEKLTLFKRYLYNATLANIAVVYQDADDNDTWKGRGDPTEIAIQVFTTRLGYARSKFTTESEDFSHLAEFPFDSSIKRMTSVYKDNSTGADIIYTKGAVERVLNCCTQWKDPATGKISTLDRQAIETIEANMDSLSSKGLRVLSFAYRNPTDDEQKNIEDWSKIERSQVERDLNFVGLIGIYDPPRPETAPSVKKCHIAGINVRMVTGDHPSTAKAIAQEVGIIPHDVQTYSAEVVKAMVMTASEFDALSDDQIDQLPVLPLVIARCAPQTKVRLIDALHRRGQFCAMTGDGVNDSPSLKKADVGIAMGLNGSDVAKDASDIVLSDDNFASILNAIEEGRRMGDNIQKFVLQLLGLNVAQAIFLMVGLVFKDPTGFSVFPLSPVQALWIIIVTSCFPAMGLGLEKASADIMEKPPKDSKENVFTWEILIDMFVYGTIMASCCMIAFCIVLYGNGNGEIGLQCNGTDFTDSCKTVFKARSCAFAVMAWSALLLAWEVIDIRRSLFALQPNTTTPYTQVFKDLWSNQFLFWSVILGFGTIFPTVYIPVINDKVFLSTGISYEWGYSVAMTFLFLLGCEGYKWGKRVYFRKQVKKAHNPESDLEKNSPFSQFHAL
ncbi:hypothetical protein BVG19_g3875 [[Candida] boidinii]|nr:hypothetical protein BVG19_g3875 [[Candida] boidinii]OWB52653.1 hypothetical protein B5S27_g4232 [[Candida] boidinii]